MIDAGSGTVVLQGQQVTLRGMLKSSSASASAVQVVSGGSILDGGASNVNVEVLNGGLVLDAVNDISFDLDVDQLVVASLGVGNIQLDAENSLTINQLIFTEGDVDISTHNGGDLTIAADIELDAVNGRHVFFDAENDLNITANLCEMVNGCVGGDTNTEAVFRAGNDVNVFANVGIKTGGGGIDMIVATMLIFFELSTVIVVILE